MIVDKVLKQTKSRKSLRIETKLPFIKPLINVKSAKNSNNKIIIKTIDEKIINKIPDQLDITVNSPVENKIIKKQMIIKSNSPFESIIFKSKLNKFISIFSFSQ